MRMAAHHDPRAATLKRFCRVADYLNDFDRLRLSDRHWG
jgi:hypothetical protein